MIEEEGGRGKGEGVKKKEKKLGYGRLRGEIKMKF